MWLKLTVIECPYYIAVSVTFSDSLSQHSKNTWQSNTVNIPRTRDDLIPKKKRLVLVINSYEAGSILFLLCASSAWNVNTKNSWYICGQITISHIPKILIFNRSLAIENWDRFCYIMKKSYYIMTGWPVITIQCLYWTRTSCKILCRGYHGNKSNIANYSVSSRVVLALNYIVFFLILTCSTLNYLISRREMRLAVTFSAY